MNKTLEPVWNEQHEILDYDRNDHLEFEIMDVGKKSSSELLGRVTLPSWKFDQDDGFEDTLNLKECGKGHQATLRVRVVVLPPTTPLGLQISEPGSRLRIVVIGVSGLPAATLIPSDNSEPLCRCHILGQPDSMFDAVNVDPVRGPRWEEVHVVPAGYEPGDIVQFGIQCGGVYLKALAGSRDFDKEGGFQGELS